MWTIWKHQLALASHQYVPLPKGARLLTVQYQGTVLTLWTLVDPEAPKMLRNIHIIGTGHLVPSREGVLGGVYVATVQDRGGYVWHVFDGGET